MADFASETALEGRDGRYTAAVAPEWEVWGPLGGYMAAIALRAMAAESELPRPAQISCHFVASAAFEPMQVEVETLRRGKRSQALRVTMSQHGRPVHVATGWTVDEGLGGLDHEHAHMPDVPGPDALKSYSELAADYEDFPRVWHTRIDGKPLVWHEGGGEPGEPVWHCWLRLWDTPPLAHDPFLEAARSLMWMDLMMWNAALQPHLPFPTSHIAPNLDVSAIFHAGAADDEWLLADAHAPVGREGIVACSGRVWTPSGRLVCSGSSSLFCRPNPYG